MLLTGARAALAGLLGRAGGAASAAGPALASTAAAAAAAGGQPLQQQQQLLMAERRLSSAAAGPSAAAGQAPPAPTSAAGARRARRALNVQPANPAYVPWTPTRELAKRKILPKRMRFLVQARLSGVVERSAAAARPHRPAAAPPVPAL